MPTRAPTMAPKLNFTRTGKRMPESVPDVGGRDLVGFFPIVDTHGIPVEMAVPQLLATGVMPDLFDFYLEAVAHGWSESNTYTRLDSAVGDNFSPEFAEGWRLRMTFIRVMLTEKVLPHPRLLRDTVEAFRAGRLPREEALLQVFDWDTGKPVHPDVAAFMLEVCP